MDKVKDISLRRFGRLFVTKEYKRIHLDNGTVIKWKCICDCSEKVFVATSSLVRGDTKSCGCLYKETRSLTHTRKHGKSKTSTYRSWLSMVKRCTDRNATAYHLYGGAGIEVCERWLSFENFLDDMGERPEATSIDRIDPGKGYFAGNCRWATIIEQARNRRTTRLNQESVKVIKYFLGKKEKTIQQLANAYGVSCGAIAKIKSGQTWADVVPA